MGKKKKEFKGRKSKQYLLDDMVEVEFWNCHEKGNFKSSFLENERNEKCKETHFLKKFVDVVVVFDSYDFVWMLEEFAYDTQRSSITDSRCTNHMCYVKEIFMT